MKIRHKLLLSILSSVFVVWSCMFYLSYSSSKKILVREIEHSARNMLDKYRFDTENRLIDVQQAAQAEGNAIENNDDISEKDVMNLIRGTMSFFHGVYGSTISFVPGTFGNKKELFGPYYYRGSDGQLVYVDLAADSYYYPKWD